jgi:hypothetical protein
MENIENIQGPGRDEWAAWQEVVKQYADALEARVPFNDATKLVQAIEAWGELLVALRLTQPEQVRTEARVERLLAYIG